MSRPKTLGMLKHGGHRLPEYTVWRAIRSRCTNPKDKAYKNYGARGINIDPTWAADFQVFLTAVGRRPEPHLTLERIKNDQGYVPGNVKWATRREQANNQRKNRNLTVNGRTQTLAMWAREIGMTPGSLWIRVYRRGMSPEAAITTPKQEPANLRSARERRMTS